ncbi:MAG: diguanylate cyclase [Methyloprofundus sp.]|nr:diguanylate cyclase [Methyloprofundus sp.]
MHFLTFVFCVYLLTFTTVTVAQEAFVNSSESHFTEQEQAYLKHKQQLSLCVDPNWMPYEKIEQGKHIGMSADFMSLFAEKIGIPIVLKPTETWTESLLLGQQRACDLFSLVLSTPEREKFLNFSAPYIGFPLVIATRYEQIFINDIANILDKPLGVQKGYAYAELLRLQYPNINLVEVPSLEEGLDQVRNNQLFAMIGSLPSIAYVFKHKYIGELKVSGKLEQLWHLGVGVRNDEALLVGVFNKAIASVDKQTRDKITSHWMTTHYELGTDYQRLLKILFVLVAVLAFFLYQHFQLKKYNRLLQHLSVTDKLTNVNNRIKLDRQLEILLKQAQGKHHAFSLILLDMDHFKNINDTYGHLVGDYVLKTLAAILEDNIQPTDTLGRWGGEEFLILCPEKNALQAQVLAEHLRHLIAAYPFEHYIKLTASFGIAGYYQDDESDSLIKRADDALYRAKEQGRNAVVLAD